VFRQPLAHHRRYVGRRGRCGRSWWAGRLLATRRANPPNWGSCSYWRFEGHQGQRAPQRHRCAAHEVLPLVAGRRRCPWFIVDRTERIADVKSLTMSAHLKSVVRQYLAKRSRRRRLRHGTRGSSPLYHRAWEMTPDPFGKMPCRCRRRSQSGRGRRSVGRYPAQNAPIAFCNDCTLGKPKGAAAALTPPNCWARAETLWPRQCRPEVCGHARGAATTRLRQTRQY